MGLAFFLGLVVVASPQHYRNDFHSANESSRIYATLALVDHGTLHLDPVFDRYFQGWRARGRPPNTDVAVKDGHYLTDKAPGISLLSVPVVAALRLLGIELRYAQLAWLLCLLLAALPSLLFMFVLGRWLCRSLGENSTVQWVAPALLLATPWLVFCAQLFGHAMAASLIGMGLILGLGPLSSEAQDPHPVRHALLGGLALGGAVLVEYPCALLALGLCVAVGLDVSRRHRLPWVILGGLGPALVLAAWNTASFGGPLSFSYGFKWNPAMAATHGEGLYGLSWPGATALYGLMLSARRGLFFLAPWLIAGVAGALWVCRDRHIARAWRISLLLGVLGVPLFIAGFGDWHGGRTLGPRYLLFSLPLFGIGAALAIQRLQGRPYAPLLLALLCGLGLSSMALALAAHLGFPHVSSQISNPMFEVVLPVLATGGPCPTLWHPFLGGYGAVAVVAACAALIALLALRKRARPNTPTEGGGDAAPAASAHGRLIPAVLLGSALLLHLTLGTLPTTANTRDVRRERFFAHQMQGHQESARRCLQAFRKVHVRTRKP